MQKTRRLFRVRVFEDGQQKAHGAQEEVHTSVKFAVWMSNKRHKALMRRFTPM